MAVWGALFGSLVKMALFDNVQAVLGRVLDVGRCS